jgi:TRAP-type C4-dicarboxylate transport system permease small subunit
MSGEDDTGQTTASTEPVPPIGAHGMVGLVDEGIHRFEKSLVTLASLVMTTTVALDIIFRSFQSSESLMARKLLTLFGFFGLEKNEANYALFRDYLAPLLLAGIAFFLGRAIANATRKETGSGSGRRGLIWGLSAVALGWIGLQVVMSLSSRWVCTGLLVAGCGGWLVVALRRGRTFDAILAIGLAIAGYFACATLPDGYGWSQELSLILLAWVAFLGGSMATRAGRHIQVDALSRVIPRRYQPYSRAIGLLLTTIFCTYLTWLAYHHVFGPLGDYSSGEIRPATGLPAWIIILSALVSFGLMTIRFGAYTVDAFANPKAQEQELVH